jgi:hypothetical protein
VRQNQLSHKRSKDALAQTRKQSVSKSAAANTNFAMRNTPTHSRKTSGTTSDLEQANMEMSRRQSVVNVAPPMFNNNSSSNNNNTSNNYNDEDASSYSDDSSDSDDNGMNQSNVSQY